MGYMAGLYVHSLRKAETHRTPHPQAAHFPTLLKFVPLPLRGYFTSYVNLCWGIGQVIGVVVIKSQLGRESDWPSAYVPCCNGGELSTRDLTLS